MMSPYWMVFHRQCRGAQKVYKVNVDDAQDIAVKYKVNSIPTLVVMKDGAEVKRFVGVTQQGALTAALEEALG